MLNQYYFLRNFFHFIFFEWRKFNIKKNNIVADLGSGGRPLSRADIVVDKFLENLTERPTEFLDTGAIIVQCDLSQLPFKNKSIDFIYSSHVVEHLENLEESLKEMQRVGKWGYITCPSAIREQIIAHKMHLWFIENKNSQLIFTQKEKPYPNFIDDFFDKLLGSPDNYKLINFEENLKKNLVIEYFWQNRINYQIKYNSNIKKWKEEGKSEFHKERPFLLLLREKIFINSAKIIRKFFSNKIDIEKILCCPVCKGEVQVNSHFVICNKCHKRYKHKNKRIFYFLNDVQ